MSIQRLGTPAYKIFFLKSNKLCRHLSLGPNFKISLLNSSFQDRWHVIYIWECSLAASLPCNLLGSIPLGVGFVLSGLASNPGSPSQILSHSFGEKLEGFSKAARQNPEWRAWVQGYLF